MSPLFWQKTAISLSLSLIGFSLVGCGERNVQSSSPLKENVTTDELLWSQLQQPETHYFVLMRHSIAPGSGDPENFAIGDCSTQRNLSEEGRKQAQRTGEAFKERNIEVEQVLSSQCMEASQIALNLIVVFMLRKI